MIFHDTPSDAVSDLNTGLQYQAAREWMTVQGELDPVHSLPLGRHEFLVTR